MKKKDKMAAVAGFLSVFLSSKGFMAGLQGSLPEFRGLNQGLSRDWRRKFAFRDFFPLIMGS
jgi:hypothetical protein